MRQITVLTHSRPAQTAAALSRLIEEARNAGVTLRFDSEETAKHRLSPQPGIVLDAPQIEDVELCVVLGGDGSILRALRRYAGTEVPVFAVNFGEIGFLATVEPDEIADGCRRALSGDFELLKLPAIVLDTGKSVERAINDVAIHRKVGERVAELSYSSDGDELGSVRCDGLVVSTPAGSTGYNLANGGPILAWGVEGYVVSYISPHSLTARALVVAPDDVLSVGNAAGREPVDVAVDGEHVGELGPGASLEVRFADGVGRLAQLPGTSFYHRIRQKFGHLAI